MLASSWMTSPQLPLTSRDSVLPPSIEQRVAVLGVDLTCRPEWFQFVVLCCTVFVFYIAYGFIQELIFQLDGMKPYGWHLTLVQFLACSLMASLERYCYDEPNRQIPLHIYMHIAVLTVGTLGFSNAAVGYLNYPTQVIFKSCKLIPVLIGGILIQGKKYSWIDATAACTMSIGLAVFILGDNKVSPMFSSTGYMMISAALLCDAVIGNVQEKFLKYYKASNNEMLLYSYSFGSLYIFVGLIVYGNLLDGLYFFIKHPMHTYGYGILFAVVGYIGVNAVLGLVRTQGALIAVTVTTVRKAITITISFLFFSKPFTIQYLWGGLLILLAVYLNLYSKNRSRWEPKIRRSMQQLCNLRTTSYQPAQAV